MKWWTGRPAASGDGRSARSVPPFRLCPLLLALSPLIAAAAEPPGAPLQATDWRDHIRYFVMLDRFDDGDPGNNDQGAGEYDPGNGAQVLRRRSGR